MKTLFLGSYGFGNLGDELCLIEALGHFGGDEIWAFSNDASATQQLTGVSRFISERHEVSELRPDRIVLGGGGVGFWPSLRDSLHWMADGLATHPNVELFVHNIGVANLDRPEWRDDRVVRRVLGRLNGFSVRDHVSRWLVLGWGFPEVDPAISYYPEVSLRAEPFGFGKLGQRPIGFSITAQPAMIACLERDRDKIRRAIADLGSFTAVPIVSACSPAQRGRDDMEGFRIFADMFLGGHAVVLREALDPSWWHATMTPLRLKHLIGQLELLVSQRKHNIIHAIGMGVPFLGIFPDEDDSILRILFTLRHRIPPRSSLLPLATGRYPAIDPPG